MGPINGLYKVFLLVATLLGAIKASQNPSNCYILFLILFSYLN